MSSSMRAKLVVTSVEQSKSGEEVTGEKLRFSAVSRSDGYPADGSDEDNTYAKYSPSASFEIYIANPALFGKFEVGEKYYVDFTPVPAA